MTRSWGDFTEDETVSRLRILLLGAPQITWRGEIVYIPRRQARALLYRLAARQEAVSREHLCYLFWPDIPDVVARRCLSHLLTHLRLALRVPELIIATGETICLNRGCVWTDTVWLHQMCCTQQTPQDLDLCWRTLDLIRGPFLEGFSLPHCPEYELWIVQEQQHWYCQIARLLSRLTSSRTIPGEPGSFWSPEHSNGDLVARDERFMARAILRQLQTTPEES